MSQLLLLLLREQVIRVLSGDAVLKIKKSKIKKLVLTDTINNLDKVKKARNIALLPYVNDPTF